jgi:hypothetical protein
MPLPKSPFLQMTTGLLLLSKRPSELPNFFGRISESPVRVLFYGWNLRFKGLLDSVYHAGDPSPITIGCNV